ncbi:hypothetical protein [Pseudomonas sp. efr-133-TYG-5]|uniref:hypothetical protein n=1 Tax=Pseudomonas sp. efr-133-TYG-5 TaxID=3040310 RepID=UPI002556B35D|nr:hypothetical protein [Pseudomonas sp. efr-133-TYG-5]
MTKDRSVPAVLSRRFYSSALACTLPSLLSAAYAQPLDPLNRLKRIDHHTFAHAGREPGSGVARGRYACSGGTLRSRRPPGRMEPEHHAHGRDARLAGEQIDVLYEQLFALRGTGSN